MNHSANSSSAKKDTLHENLTSIRRTRATTRRRRLLLTSLASSCLLVLPSCKIPDLRLPKCGRDIPSSYEETTAVSIPNNGESSAQIPWCEFFTDPDLNALINQAFVDNQELKILAEDIRIAQYEVYGRSGAYLPFFSLGGRAGIDKSSRFTRAGAVEDQLFAAPGKGFPEPLPDFLVATNITWEIDIWKKLRNARTAAAYRYLGTREGRNFVVTRLIADIAGNYYKLLALDNRMKIIDQTIEIQQKSLDAAKDLKAAGRATELAVQRFEAEVRRNQSEKLIVQQEIVETENEVNFAVGRFPQYVDRQQVDYLALNLHALSTGFPSQLLQNRADIRQAERELTAAGLEVSVARAKFYPSLVMTAGVGYEAFNTRYLLSSPESLIYNTAGELVAPLINRRAIQAEYQTANAEQLQAVYNYQRTVLNAFTEVINYITAVENYGRSIDVKKQQLSALEKSVEVATTLFKNAKLEYIDLLLAQREMMEARRVIVDVKQQQLLAIVNAYQALGGGGAPTRSEVVLGEVSSEIITLDQVPSPDDAESTAPTAGSEKQDINDKAKAAEEAAAAEKAKAVVEDAGKDALKD